MRTRVKICGITRPEDGQAAARAGADAIGLVFYAHSPRCVDIRQAQEICAAEEPALIDRGAGHVSACHFAEELELVGIADKVEGVEQ